jgi:aminoglycoside 6'-N-acetyltransferase
MPVTLRPATPADSALLRRWDRQAHVVAAKGDDDWRWETELGRQPDWREQLIAEAGGRPVGFVQIIDPAREESHYWSCTTPGRRAIDLWIGDAADTGRGLGSDILRQTVARCFADPSVAAVLVDPLIDNERARRFYERLGFEFAVHRRFGEDDCAVYRLTREKAAATGLSA